MFDIIIRCGQVIDGTGNSWAKTDIGIKDGWIKSIGNLTSQSAGRIINAQGYVVAPGFIDIHSHSDISIVTNPRAENTIKQGITTVVVGNCGNGTFHVTNEKRHLFREYLGWILSALGTDLTWNDDEYLEKVGEGISVNIAPLIAHGNIRIAAMGVDNRDPSEQEMSEMKKTVEQFMQAGFFGISTGLIYPPGSYSKTDELVELCHVVAGHNGCYVSHIRGEADTVVEAVAEAIEIGRRANIPVQISHHKACGKANWGKTEDTLAMMRKARSEGIDVACDVYPYLACISSFYGILPPWLLEGGVEKMAERLKDQGLRQKVKREMEEESASQWNSYKAAGGWDKFTLQAVQSVENKQYEGMTVLEIAAARGIDPFEAVFDLMLQESQIRFIVEMINQDDLERLIRWPFTAIGSDGWSEEKETMLSRSRIHPRNYGTFARVLGRFVREQGVLHLEDAIRKMTSLPAKRIGIDDRGLLRAGMVADIVIFDAAKVIDRATYHNPRQFAEGVCFVLVNGVVVLDQGEHTGALPGKMLLKGMK